jgi:hypothetical protein
MGFIKKGKRLKIKNLPRQKDLGKAKCFLPFGLKIFKTKSKRLSCHKQRELREETWYLKQTSNLCSKTSVFIYEFFDLYQCAAYTIIQAKLKGREHHTTTSRRWQGRKLLEIITVAMLKLILKLCRM